MSYFNYKLLRGSCTIKMNGVKCGLNGIQMELIVKDKQEQQAIGKLCFCPLLLCDIFQYSLLHGKLRKQCDNSIYPHYLPTVTDTCQNSKHNLDFELIF